MAYIIATLSGECNTVKFVRWLPCLLLHFSASTEQQCIVGTLHGNLHICRGDSYLPLVKAPAGSGGPADASERKGARLFVCSGGAASWCVGHIKIFDRLQDYENGSVAPGCSAALSERWELWSGPFGATQCVLIPCNEIKGFWAALHLASLTAPFFFFHGMGGL